MPRSRWSRHFASTTTVGPAEALALDGKRSRASKAMDAAFRHALAGGEDKWHTHTWDMLLGAFCLLCPGQMIDRHYIEVFQRLQAAAGISASTPRDFAEYRDDVRAWMTKAGKAGCRLKYLGEFPGQQP